MKYYPPYYDANETKGEVEDSGKQIGEGDVVRKLNVLHHGVVVVAVKKVGILHKTLHIDER